MSIESAIGGNSELGEVPPGKEDFQGKKPEAATSGFHPEATRE
jgi:hypothetical protein